MAMAVLRSHDSLDNRFHLSAFASPEASTSPSPAPKARRRKSRSGLSPTKTSPSPNRATREKATPPKSTPEKVSPAKSTPEKVSPAKSTPEKSVKILKRGEKLPVPPYAGPAYWVGSPEPSAVPLPAVLLQRAAEAAARSEEATRGLRFLLQLGVEP